MITKALGKSGRRILKAIKKLSTSSRLMKKFEKDACVIEPWAPEICEPDEISLRWSLKSPDTRSTDTFMTFLGEGFIECSSNCSYCIEHEENQKNENRENEMFL